MSATMDALARAVENGNVNLPTGILWGTDKAYSVESQGQLTTARDFGALVVAYRDGAPVRLRDLGRVVDSVQDDQIATWFKDQRAIVLAVRRQRLGVRGQLGHDRPQPVLVVFPHAS